MNQTHVMVEFVIFGDTFPIAEITERLAIEPTQFHYKGDLGKNHNVKKETRWALSTGYEESLDVEDQLSKIMNQIRRKKTILKALKLQYHLSFKFYIVIKIVDGQTPAIYFDEEMIRFASELRAPFDIDTYVWEKE